MTNSTNPAIRTLLAVLVCAAFAPSALAQTAPAIEVRVADLHSTVGKVWICLWKEGQTSDFPNCDRASAFAKQAAPASAPSVVFPNVPAGAYAISIFHDEKGTGVPEKTLIGLPKSGVGLSNNPDIGITSPPTFAKARFIVGTEAVQHNIKAKYLF